MTHVTSIVFVIAAAACVFYAYSAIREARRFEDWWDARFGGPDTSDAGAASKAFVDAQDATEVAAAISVWIGVTTFVLVVFWLYQATVAARRFGATDTPWVSRRWAIGGWFIPVANLVIPKLTFNQIEQVSSPEAGPAPVGDRWWRAPPRADGWFWWLSLLAGLVVLVTGLWIQDGDPLVNEASFDPNAYRDAYYIIAAGLVLLATSAFAGAVMIRRLGAQINRPLATTGS